MAQKRKRKRKPVDYKKLWAKNKKSMIINGTLENYRESCRLRVQKFRQIHKLRLQAEAKEKLETDECTKLKNKICNMMRRALKNPKYKVYIPFLELWSHEFRAYMRGQFERWMKFSNHGNYSASERRWQIDHMVPLSSAKGDIEKLKELLHFTNVRPKDAHQNICERNKR